jgi:hypothetical protein
MGEDKVQVILTDEGGKQVPFYTKTLTEEFKNKAGKKYKVAIQEPGGSSVNIGNYTVKGGAIPPVPDNKPPVVHAGEDQAVKPGATVTLVASDSDEDGIVSVEDWRQEQGALVKFVYPDPANKKIVTFVAPSVAAELVFAFSATDDKGAVVIDKMRVAVGEVTPPVPPVPPVPPTPPVGVTYDSNIQGKWKNGHARTFTDFDPDMPKPYQNGKGLICAASGKPEITIDGQGTFTLKGKDPQGGHPRGYLDSINYNSSFTFEMQFNDDKVQNATFQRQSRHQEEDQNEKDNENAFGGINHEIDFAGQKAGLKIERFHTPEGGEHDNFPDKPLPKKIGVKQWFGVKLTDISDAVKKTVYQNTVIDFLDGKGFIKVNEHLMENCPDYYINPIKFKQRSYGWLRLNNAQATEGISIRNVIETAL